MSTQLKIAAVLTLALLPLASTVEAGENGSKAKEVSQATDWHSAVADLEEAAFLALLVGDYELADKLNNEILLMEYIAQVEAKSGLARTTTNIAGMDLGSGR